MASLCETIIAHFNPAIFQPLEAAVIVIPTSRAFSLIVKNGTKLFSANVRGA